MSVMIQISSDTYELLQRRARETQSTPEHMAETAIRLQLGGTVHIEQRQTPFGLQAYMVGTRVAVRHVAAFLRAGHTAEEIIKTALPHIPPAAIYEAIAYYYDHQEEIEAELAANSQDAIQAQLRELLSPAQYARLTRQSA